MRLLAAICVALSGLLFQPTPASAYEIKDRPFLGVVTRLTCRAWLDDFMKSGEQSKQYADWLRGYLSGYNMLYQASRHMLFEYEMPWAIKLTTTYCKKLPESLMSASGANVVAFYNEIHENALKHTQPGNKHSFLDAKQPIPTYKYILVEHTYRSCGAWLDKQAKNDADALEDDKAYIFGFFSAYNQFIKQPAYIFTNTDETMILDAVRQGCHGNQQEHIAGPMMDYIVRLQADVKKQQARSHPNTAKAAHE